MAYRIFYKKSVSRDLSKLDKKEASQVLSRMEKDLSRKAGSYPVLKRKYAGLRKYRVGNYRVIYAFVKKDVRILRIGHRREINKEEI